MKDRFGKLTVIGPGPVIKGKKKVLCRCDCGNSKFVMMCNLQNKSTKSCGCVRSMVTGLKNKTHGVTTGANGDSKKLPKEYVAWRHMWQRCTDRNCTQWEYYGGRGVSVCEEWKDYEAFLAHVGPRPSERHSIDRYPNKNGNYEPNNVRWATKEEQARNMRSNVLLTIDGKTMTALEWSREMGINYSTLLYRIHNGWEPSNTIKKPKESKT